MPYITPDTSNVLAHISMFRQAKVQHGRRLLLLLTDLRKLRDNIGNTLSGCRLVPVNIITKVRLVVVLNLMLNPVQARPHIFQLHGSP